MSENLMSFFTGLFWWMLNIMI